jgi:hypothetical protein
VTALAILTKTAFMNVTFTMATVAAGRSFQLITFYRLPVAIKAIGLLVCAIDLVFGATLMVEIPALPVSSVMAAVALVAEPQLVLVFLLVTGIAV